MYLRRCDICGYTEELDELNFEREYIGTSLWGKPKEKDITSHLINTGERDKKGKSKLRSLDLCSKCFNKIHGASEEAEIAAYNKLIEENK